MAKRNKTDINIIWLHMDATHPDYNAAILVMRVQHENQGSFKLSINLKDDGTEALVKIIGILSTWPENKAWAVAVKRVFTETDHDEAVVLVKDLLWEPLSI